MSALFDELDRQVETVVKLQRELTAIPALGPKNGGEGEKAKADYLMGQLKSMGIQDIQEFSASDPSVPCGFRPNIAAVIPGEDQSRTLWVISHMDIVPVGDLSLWESDPFDMVRNDDILIGRGVEDNQQGIVSSLIVAKAMLDLSITPKINFGLLFVADEETGSEFGLDYVVNAHKDLFGPDDMFLVPDSGEPTGEMVEIAEKSMFWLKIMIQGKQCHASTPEQGVNAMVPAAAMILKLKELENVFDAEDSLFSPPRSTFQPTKREANVENINTIPGSDVFYLDSRVMPQYTLDEVMDKIREYGVEIEKEYGVTVSYEKVMWEQAAPSTPVDSDIVKKVMESVRRVYGNDPRPMGVGGGTVAAFLRRKGYHAVVWATLYHNAHQPNESASIKNAIGDAKVIADMLLS